MKTLSIQDIITKVRTKYDEIGLNDSEMIGDTDSEHLDTIIRSNIETAYRYVSFNADESMIEGKEVSGPLTIREDLVGTVSLPSDFLRCISVRLSSWHSAGTLIDESSPEYRMQYDPFACGTYQNPVAALIHNNGRKLELFKAKTGSDTLVLVYVPTCGSENIDVSDQLVESFIYYVAGLTATTFREDVANDFFNIAKGLLGNE